MSCKLKKYKHNKEFGCWLSNGEFLSCKICGLKNIPDSSFDEIAQEISDEEDDELLTLMEFM